MAFFACSDALLVLLLGICLSVNRFIFLACGSGFWGQGCVNQCGDNCPLAGQCDIVTGLCICPSGFGGQYCNICEELILHVL